MGLTLFDCAYLALPLIPSIVYVVGIKDTESLVLISFSVLAAVAGFVITCALIPQFGEYTKKRGLSGKDLGKKGTSSESIDVPEALGLVCGVVYLVCTIASQLVYAKDQNQMIVYNSALFSVCFMIFLGFLDDTLDLKWRYKLLLPTIASLPLLSSYSGSTAMYVAKPFAGLLMQDNKLTMLGAMVNLIATVDTEANGQIIELGFLFLIFMGLQAVFCTNAINIFAGINGLECGQSYIIACSLLFFKVYELYMTTSDGGVAGEDQKFAILMVVPFIGTSLGLLRFNWYPAKVFVGDTFCYFAGMTFAVIGIHSHFSKTLLMLFIPQIINFIYSVPQLFKLMPCPRHRLPRFHPETQLMSHSAFSCRSDQYQLFKVRRDDVECPNCTLICLVLRIFGPMHEKTLCISLLSIQCAFSALAFWVRYVLLE